MENKRLYGIRGATGVENTKESIIENVGQMFKLLFLENNVKSEDIVSIQFTMTQDIDSFNAAAALRKSDCPIDVSNCALFCSVEPQMNNSLPLMIRTLITVYLPEGSNVQNVYLNRATALRPDFVKK